jgi:hypothetical protein
MRRVERSQVKVGESREEKLEKKMEVREDNCWEERGDWENKNRKERSEGVIRDKVELTNTNKTGS